MAINKHKNVMIQITFPKDDAKNLEALRDAFNKEGIKCTKSDILLQAFRDYLKILVGLHGENKQEQEDNKEENDNA